jgi:hypothetical protein
MRLILALVVLLAGLSLAVGDFSLVIDLKAMAVVVSGGLAFVIVGKHDVQSRIENFSIGAVAAAWIGGLIGFIHVVAQVTDVSSLAPAVAILILTLSYGYFIKILCSLFIINRWHGD